MATQRLPIPGSDNGTWGSILNGFLGVSLNSDGTINPTALTQAGAATLASPSFTGTPTAPTASPGTNTTQLATTAFTTTAVSALNGTYVPTSGGVVLDEGGAVFNVRAAAYGAVGNGSTSDGAALNAALAAASSIPGSVIYFPRSPNNAAYVLNTGPYTLPSGVSVLFAQGAKVQVPASASVGLFILNSGCTVENLTCDGASGSKSTTAYCIQFANSATDCHVINPTITNWCGVGVYGIANTRPLVERGSITATIGGVRFTTGSSNGWSGIGDVVSPVVCNVNVSGCTAGTGIQLDGDWNNSTWKTAGYKVRNGSISGCVSSGNYYAGIFINSGFNCSIVGCHAYSNSDYGIGMEYSDHSTVSTSTSYSNATYGFAIEQNGQYCTFTSCIAQLNTQHGIWVNYNSGTVSGDTAGLENAVTGCICTSNGGHGIEVSGGTINTTLTGNVCRSNSLRGIDLNGCNESVVTGGRCSYNTEDGLGLSFVTDITITGVDSSHNTLAGINLASSTTDFTIEGCNIHHNTNTGIKFPATSVTEGLIVGNRVHDNTGYAIDSSPYLPTYIRVTGNRIRNNSSGGVRFIEGYDCEISENRIQGNTSGGGVGISVLDSSGFSGGRFSIRNNKLRTLATGITFSVGANVSSGDDVYVQDNEISPNVTTAYSYGAIGTVANLFFRAVLPAVPNSSIYGAPGSMVTVSAGGSATTLWVKESGTNTTTGWVGK